MQSRLSYPETVKFRSDLGFNQINLILKKEQTVLKSIKDTFEGEDMQTQYTVIGYKIDLYFHKPKLAIEVDELGYVDRNLNNEIEGQKAVEKEHNCVSIRINLDEKDFKIFKEINKTYRHITQSKEENQRKEQESKIKEKEKKIKEQKSKFANELLTYVSNISIPLKPIKYFVKKYFPHCRKSKAHNQK